MQEMSGIIRCIMGWWKDEEEPFAAQWETLSQAAGAKQTAFLLGDFNSEADVRGEGYDLILRSGWQDTYQSGTAAGRWLHRRGSH